MLFGPNDPRNNGNYGFEHEMARPQVDVRHISSASTERFILEIEGRAISGIAVKGAGACESTLCSGGAGLRAY